MQAQVISTYAKHMVCPPELISKEIVRGDITESEVKERFNSYKFRHSLNQYTGKESPSTEVLIEKIKNAVSISLRKDRKPLLLLSDGKDSLAIALALYEIGISCETITLLRQEDNKLKEYLKKVCSSLGHLPTFYTVEDIVDLFDYDMIVSSFSKESFPVMDQAYTFFLFAINDFFKSNGLDSRKYQIIDGMGNDEYFGHIPSKLQLRSLKISKIKKLLPSCVYSGGLSWYLREAEESHGLKSALSAFFWIKRSADISVCFRGLNPLGDDHNIVDFRAYSRGRVLDNHCLAQKTRCIANFHQTEAIFPWLNSDLSRYCFNLPVEKKFNLSELKNKILLREMLEDKLSWKQEKRGVDLFLDFPIKSDFLRKSFEGNDKIWVYEKILKNKFWGVALKKRALLEAINLCAYCDSNNIKVSEILI